MAGTEAAKGGADAHGARPLAVTVEAAEQHAGECMELLRKLVELESPTGDEAANLAVAALIEAAMVEAGGRVERVAAPGFGVHLVGRFDGAQGDGRAPLLVVGHMDTVHAVGTLERLPFAVKGGRAQGPGIYDMKGGVAASLTALRLLAERGLRPGSNVSFLVTCDEEQGSRLSRGLIEAEARASRAALVVEPSVPGGGVKSRRKGVSSYVISVAGRAAHAGIEPEAGANSVHELARQVCGICDLADSGAGTTVNVCVMSGGSRENVVPDAARATIDVRFWDVAEADRIDAALRSLESFDPGCRVSVRGGVNRGALEKTPASARLYDAARGFAAELGFELGEGETGGGSDGNLASAVGCPTLDGLGPDGGGAHTLHEHVLVRDLPRRAALMAALFERL